MKRDAEWAFNAYEAVRDRLPSVVFPDESVQIVDIGDVADRFDVFLLDAFGVLNIGGAALPNAVTRVAELQAAGKRVLVLTNGATFPADQSLAKYRRWGFEFAAEDVVSSRDAMATALPSYSVARWGVMAREASRADELPADVVLLEDDATVYADVDGFILMSAGEWTAERQELLVTALARRPRPVLVGNPDIVSPHEAGLALEPGYFAHDAASRAGVRPEFFGKPFDNVFDLALSRVKAGARVAMVGDTLHTDVLGGRAAGLSTILVASHGLFAGLDTGGFVARSGIVPDYVATIT